MDDDYYMTDEEIRLLEKSEEYYYDHAYVDIQPEPPCFDRFNRMEYWEDTFTKKLKKVKTSLPSSECETGQKSKDHPVFYGGAQIDMKSLHELLQSQGLSGDKASYVCKLIKSSIPIKSEKKFTNDTKDKLIATKIMMNELIFKLKVLAIEDKALTPYVESFNTYVDPVDFLSEVQYTIQDMLQSYFPNEKVKRDHYRFSNIVGQIWRTHVGKPTIYTESPFVKFLSICTCTTQEATKKRIYRHGLQRRIKSYAPF